MHLAKAYRKDSTALCDPLLALFHLVDQGSKDDNLPPYNGGLFISKPNPEDISDEVEVARFLLSHKVPDFYLARGLDLLARDEDEKTFKHVFIDYKSLGVRQLGSIYEGLLEFKLRIASEKLGIVKVKGKDIYKPWRELSDSEKAKLEKLEAKESLVLRRGDVFLENDKRERKATGSYYTPDYIVKYIVEHAVGPILKEKFEAVTPKIRDAQKRYRQRLDNLKAMGKSLPEHELAKTYGREVVDELFDIKVLDPAMGSGHFLVQAVDFITDRMLDFLNGFPWNPVTVMLEETRRTILSSMEDMGITIDAGRLTDVNLLKRHVLKRCIYGVDLNPMAVELAKVSLWLDCFTLGAPLSFLDHHLRCGNSLIGVSVKEVQEAVEPITKVSKTSKVAASATEWKTVEVKGEQFTLFGSRFAGLLLATDLMRHVGKLSDVTSAQVRESRAEYRRASDALAPFKRILDAYTSQWFGDKGEKKGRSKKGTSTDTPALDFLKAREAEAFLNARDDKSLKQALKQFSPQDCRVAEIALAASGEKRFFHWELEFPEVFYGPRKGAEQVIERLEYGGFDAVIGNPPYDVLASEELGYDISQDLAFYEATALYEPAIRGKKNLYKLFVCRGAAITQGGGAFSFIVPMALLGDDQAAGVRRLLLEKAGLITIEAFPQKDDPHNRVFEEAKLPTAVFITRGKPTGKRFLVRTHAGRLIESTSSTLELAPSEVLAFDPGNATIASCTQEDWKLVTRLLASKTIRRMCEIAKSFQGEVNETNERAKGALSSRSADPIALRGANICMYAVREASQGEDVRLHVKKFLTGKTKDAKAFAHRSERTGFQRSSPQNNFRRIIAARIPRGSFCLDTVSYVTEESSQMNLDLLLALLNSKILEWYFRLGSTNSKVNEYQFNALPVPAIIERGPDVEWKALLAKGRWGELAELLGSAVSQPCVMPRVVAEALAEMSRRIQEVEARRILKNRSERSRLAPESQPIQDAIDAVLFRCYGLTEDEGRYITRRLREML